MSKGNEGLKPIFSAVANMLTHNMAELKKNKLELPFVVPVVEEKFEVAAPYFYIKISHSVLKQSIFNIYSKTSFCGFHTEVTLSVLWENGKLNKIK